MQLELCVGQRGIGMAALLYLACCLEAAAADAADVADLIVTVDLEHFHVALAAPRSASLSFGWPFPPVASAALQTS